MKVTYVQKICRKETANTLVRSRPHRVQSKMQRVRGDQVRQEMDIPVAFMSLSLTNVSEQFPEEKLTGNVVQI